MGCRFFVDGDWKRSLKSSPSSSSPVPTRRWTHDVFLSFRGEDTRNNFVDHLYTALHLRGIHVFKDDKELHKGKPISQELLKAIEESKFAVVVFSKNYAESSWCLDELVKIMECRDHMRQIVLPVFYHVEPSHVRGQKRDYDSAFHKHDKFTGETDRVTKWRNVLVAAGDISGWHVKETDNGGESAIITEIVRRILDGRQPGYMEKSLIGIDSRIEELYSLLGMKAEATREVRMIGVFGMGGIGKTTIAKALFRRIAHMFDGSSFVEDVRKNSICVLQQKILSEVLGIRVKLYLKDPDEGANMIKRQFSSKKVLLVLDDVDDIMQLKFLVATHEWFGPGSRIIISTRNQHLLTDVDAKYKPNFLNMNESVKLFCQHAFRRSSPPEGYIELSHRAVRHAGSLPLALEVLGGFFYGREIGVWESALHKLAEASDDKILDILKLSFDGLDVYQKKIFLDIACFFNGKDKEHVTRVLDSFGYHAVIGIKVLEDKSLITISNERLNMHDLIQAMGWQIVRERFLDSRLWQLEQLHDFVMGRKNPIAIEAITLMDDEYKRDDYDAKLGLSADVFAVMKNLRLLDIDRKLTSTQPSFLPDELRWLRWNEYGFSFLPLADMCKLVGLEMAYGDIKHLWKGRKILPNLKHIHLERMYDLTSFPDVSGAPNIERLILSRCGLVEVHESLGSHRGIVHLDMTGCHKLKHLPSRIEMESLKTLILSGCKSLKRFPRVSPCMVKLSQINLSSCSLIKKLPSSIRYLSSLNFLNLTNCSSLKSIPDSICELKDLECLLLYHCGKLKNLPKKLGCMKMLKELWLGYNYSMGMSYKSFGFHSLTGLSSLMTLNLSGRQIEEESFSKNLDAFSSLERLSLSGNLMLVQLPESIFRLSRLKCLELNDCSKLESLCELPSSLQVLKANECSSLKKIRDLSTECKWLYKIWMINCKKLQEDEESQRYLDKILQQSFIKKCAAVDHRLSIAIPGSKIPSWFREEKDGCSIALKLSHKWHTKIMGFVICGVFDVISWSIKTCPRIIFRIVNDKKVIPKSEVVYSDMMDATETSMSRRNVWMSYLPLGSFQKMYRDLQPEDWSHIEGNLDITIMLTDGRHAIRCGAHVIYKEDVQQITTCVDDYGNVVHVDNEDFGDDQIMSGISYVYEEKFDEKDLMPLGSRSSTSQHTRQIAMRYCSREYPDDYAAGCVCIWCNYLFFTNRYFA